MRPSSFSKAEFLARFGGVYGAPWVAEAIWPAAADGRLDRLGVLSAALRETVEAAPFEQQLVLVRSQPALALGQADARLWRLQLAYALRFGFPFVLAMRGVAPGGAARALLARLANPPELEFETALAQLHRIASFRLAELFAEAAARRAPPRAACG